MITITAMSNAVYKSADGNIVDVDIMTEAHGLITTTIVLNNNDQEPHVLELKAWIAENSVRPFVPVVESPARLAARKDSQVDSEIGTDAVRILLETLLPYIDAGLSPVDILNEAKSKRRLEL